MEELKLGEIAVLENKKEYVVISEAVYQGEKYVYLMSNSKPIKLQMAKQIIDNNELKLEIITDNSIKRNLLNLFQKIQ